ncbi:hypothetical protein QBC47DRAFT_457037 [Echria macrotheca]|uniref:tRNA-splicing endonuclease subunit Sen54 N-terminal domain-containing protein n=1 Tax=Echria macrotheca TaxID=438768 RepID=A0AAJ0BNA0_9PEZI|nr:hypothetical protein QBC47DRAFT_457037 [Echria macrotheca]
MSLDDYDTPTAAPVAGPSTEGGEEGLTAEEALEDETQDFRMFSKFNKSAHVSAQTIRKGEKDFEQVGTRKQEDALEQSRQAMHDVLSYTRVHHPNNWTRAWYFPDWWADWNDDGDDQRPEKLGESGERKPYAHVRDRVVLLEGPSVASNNLGRTPTGQPKDRPARGMDWLLPEEALFLVERGSLDLWWPTRGIEDIFPAAGQSKKDRGGDDADNDEDEYEMGFPLSLQAAYSLLIGEDGERGKISLQKFQVFSNLKRAGYNVLRAPPPQRQPFPESPPPTTLWQWFSSLIPSLERQPRPFGPLLQPGIYRSYVPIYRQLAIIPRHQPSPEPSSRWGMKDPFAIHYHIWKAAGKWSKLRHPPPDFYLAVVDAQETDVPSLEEITALVDATPPAPHKPEWRAMGPRMLAPRLKHGYRHVLVAVVDHGIINYMRFAEGTFVDEPQFERMDGSITEREAARLLAAAAAAAGDWLAK